MKVLVLGAMGRKLWFATTSDAKAENNHVRRFRSP